MSDSVKITRSANTVIEAKTQTGNGHRITVGHFMWMSRVLQEAIDAGMPTDTEVEVHNPSTASGVTLKAVAVLRQEIP